MNKSVVVVTVAMTAASSFAGWGDFGKAAAKEGAATAIKVAAGSINGDEKKCDKKCEASKDRDRAVADEKAKKDAVAEKQTAKMEADAARLAAAPSVCGKKYDWSFTNDWGFKTDYHTRIASGKEIERQCDGEFQIQQFHNDDYGFHWIGFHTLADLEYAIDQLDAYVTKCAGWQKVAIENEVEGMRKDDEKTKFAIDKDGNRVEWFIFCTKKNKQGKIMGYFDVRWTDKHDQFLKGFNNVENDGCIEFWQKQVEGMRKAVELYKAEVAASEAKAQKLKNAANLFN